MIKKPSSRLIRPHSDTMCRSSMQNDPCGANVWDKYHLSASSLGSQSKLDLACFECAASSQGGPTTTSRRPCILTVISSIKSRTATGPTAQGRACCAWASGAGKVHGGAYRVQGRRAGCSHAWCQKRLGTGDVTCATLLSQEGGVNPAQICKEHVLCLRL